MKVAINKCYGGFNLSKKGYEELIKLGWEVTEENENNRPINRDAQICKSDSFDSGYYFIEDNIDPDFRKHVDLIQVIEKLGNEASGGDSKIIIINVDDDCKEFTIHNYDGLETVHEKHRQWG